MSEKNIWIAVPSYWTYASGQEGEELTVFDHPTPLDETGTMGRMFESFLDLEGEVKVLVVAAGTHPSIADAIHNKVSDIIKPYADKMEIYLVSPKNLPIINSLLPEPILKLDSYGNIRNVQLALPYAMGADGVLGIDDDEVVLVKDHIQQAADSISGTYCGEIVAGIAGPYFDSAGSYQLSDGDELKSEPNIFLKKNYFMNEALKHYMNAELDNSLIRCNVAFGGNMVMARETIACACHDPYIPRGEDYDYVINAAMKGKLFCFRPGMGITHLPPGVNNGSQADDKISKLTADIGRFIYMNEKMKYHIANFPEEKIDLDYLRPYPAPYLEVDVDLAAEAVKALDSKYPKFREKELPEEFVANVVETTKKKVVEFFEYRERWEAMTAVIGDDAKLQSAIEEFKVNA